MKMFELLLSLAIILLLTGTSVANRVRDSRLKNEEIFLELLIEQLKSLRPPENCNLAPEISWNYADPVFQAGLPEIPPPVTQAAPENISIKFYFDVSDHSYATPNAFGEIVVQYPSRSYAFAVRRRVHARGFGDFRNIRLTFPLFNSGDWLQRDILMMERYQPSGEVAASGYLFGC